MYSIKDVLVKANNKFGGKVNSRFWRVLSERERKSLKYGEVKGRCIDEELIPPEPIYIKMTNTMVVVSNGKVVDGMMDIGTVIPFGTEDIIGYEFMDAKHWVYSIYHFDGVWVLYGFQAKGEALKKLMAEKKNPKVFEVVFFQMTNGKYIGVPTSENFYYPVADYLNSRFSSFIHYTHEPVHFDIWVLDYLNCLIRSFIRENPQDSQEWYLLHRELKDCIDGYSRKRKIDYTTVFSIYDRILQYQYGGVDISDLF